LNAEIGFLTLEINFLIAPSSVTRPFLQIKERASFTRFFMDTVWFSAWCRRMAQRLRRVQQTGPLPTQSAIKLVLAPADKDANGS